MCFSCLVKDIKIQNRCALVVWVKKSKSIKDCLIISNYVLHSKFKSQYLTVFAPFLCPLTLPLCVRLSMLCMGMAPFSIFTTVILSIGSCKLGFDHNMHIFVC